MVLVAEVVMDNVVKIVVMMEGEEAVYGRVMLLVRMVLEEVESGGGDGCGGAVDDSSAGGGNGEGGSEGIELVEVVIDFVVVIESAGLVRVLEN